MPIDTHELTLGFLPLIDCAPLAVAREQGFFEAEGLRVHLSREASWAVLRDKLCVGALQGAQMLSPMPLAISLGLSGLRTPLICAFSLSLNGNAITIANTLREELRQIDPRTTASPRHAARALKRLVDQRREDGQAALTFATVYPFSCHNYLLRYWLAAAGIDPDQDINLVVIPPPRMAAQLAAGRIDGLCVGEPWNQVAAAPGHGDILMDTARIWRNAPEKVLAVREDWAERQPATHQALLRALSRACAWLSGKENRDEAVVLLSQPEYLDLPPQQIAHGWHTGGHVFHEEHANFPWRSHALWLLSQMLRWGQLPRAMALRSVAERVYRPDIYRETCASLSLPCPDNDYDYKAEGAPVAPVRDGEPGPRAESFMDGRRFNSRDVAGYLAGFEIHGMNLSAEDMALLDQ